MPEFKRICPTCQKEFTSKRSAQIHCSRVCGNKQTNFESDFQRFWSKVKITEPGGCWEWQDCILPYGYGKFFVGPKRYIAHRYSYQLCHGAIPEGLFICHKCDNRKCVNPAHLWAGTQKDNMQDCVQKGRLNTQTGPKDPMRPYRIARKLTEQKVIQIRELHATGQYTYVQLGRLFEVDRTLIGQIIRRQIWTRI